MRYWWVNQNQTHEQEVRGGFLWSPKKNSNGRSNRFYDNMTLVQNGDLIFSFFGSSIRAIGIARGAAQSADKPNFGSVGKQWGSEGWLVPVEFTELLSSLRPKSFIDELYPLLPGKYSPLQANGNGNQGVYLAEISEKAAEKIFEKIRIPLTEFVARRTDNAEDNGAEDAEQKAIAGRTDIGPTQKQQLINSRRGQGIFRANVRLNETRCRVTGVTDITLLIASHIKPWIKSDDQEKLDGCNGLLLSPHVDKLFDRGFVSFQKDDHMLISSMLNPLILKLWSIDPNANVGRFNDEQDVYLEYHRTTRFKP